MTSPTNSSENNMFRVAGCSDGSFQRSANQLSILDVKQPCLSANAESIVEYDPLYYLIESQRLDTQTPNQGNQEVLDILDPLHCWTESELRKNKMQSSESSILPPHMQDNIVAACKTRHQASPLKQPTSASDQGRIPQLLSVQPMATFSRNMGHCQMQKLQGSSAMPITRPFYNMNSYVGPQHMWPRSLPFPFPHQSSLLSPLHQHQHQPDHNCSTAKVKHTSTVRSESNESCFSSCCNSSLVSVLAGESGSSACDTAIHDSIENEIAKPLSAYNFFFSEERERLILENGKANGTTASHRRSDEKSHKTRMKRLLDQRVSVKDKNKPRRKHRKMNGKIDFSTLSKLISQRWRHLPLSEKKFFQQVADADLLRYRMQLSNIATQTKTQSSSTAISHS